MNKLSFRSALLAASLSLTAFSLPSHAGELAVFAGNGNSVDTVGVVYRMDPWKSYDWGNWGKAVVLGEAEVGSWHGKEAQAAGKETNRSILEIGFKPVLRYYPTESTSFRPYIDAGLGVHLLSHTAINQERRLPTAFEFGEVLGVGAEFCPKLACSVNLRLQHVSNGGLKQPNNGITFTQVSFGYKF